jgi:hypothetical protein
LSACSEANRWRRWVWPVLALLGGLWLGAVARLLSGLETDAEPALSIATDPPADITPVAEPAVVAQQAAPAREVLVSISLAFRPVRFEIPAQSGSLALADKPDPQIHHAPVFSGQATYYASLPLKRSPAIALALDIGTGGARLFVDKNRNGDLRDDGAPLENVGSGAFSSPLPLSLPRVSGLAALSGDYLLWLYLTDAMVLHYYALTQLRGQIRLDGALYDVWLADNQPLDGDFQNDGLYIDLNRDGEINPAMEYVAPEQVLSLAGQRYRFLVRP